MTTIEERAKEKGKIYCRQYRHNAKWLGEDFVFSNEEIELACKDIATEQRKIDIEERFGTLNHIQSVLQSIVNSAERLTSGNIAHNKASIKLLASGLLDYVMNKE